MATSTVLAAATFVFVSSCDLCYKVCVRTGRKAAGLEEYGASKTILERKLDVSHVGHTVAKGGYVLANYGKVAADELEKGVDDGGVMENALIVKSGRQRMLEPSCFQMGQLSWPWRWSCWANAGESW
ncbi:uncharacterized protein K452DRAFT_339938 [Aplosporella prunicola CBS 121167]|uniref:Uncharacterized protein n=1 Tax=Aplosporella prunicola CBS 121167 TaxID=1176127 RepID=A0A6A6B318_9PEZI|nr:uncharacterized protein K452DRAFT_339938 [Aplosporella prunicola CBS 121167]KAF2137773.1 hypothetical protein K452DRAFT_339938 [Aplosporella prunicola CBS 121167]